jgi:glycosyltransferase involved in cell wall biosynthesis
VADRRGAAVAVNPLPWVAGGETTLLRLLPGLAQRGWRVSATVPGPGRLREALEAGGVTVRRLPLGPPERRTPASYAGAALAAPLLRAADVALLNGLSTQRAVPGLRLARRPAVLLVNNPLPEPPPAWSRPRHWQTVRAVAAASDHVATECRAAGAPAERVHTAYPAAWAQGDPPGAGAPPPSGERVLFVGQIEPRKGVLELLAAARTFLEGRPAATLTLLGEPTAGHEDYAEKVRRAATAPELDGRVRLAGFAPDAATAMTGYDLVVVPSLAEPYGTVAAEAAAAGRPAVISAVGGMAEVVLDGVTGLHVPPGDPAALAAAVAALLDDPTRLAAMGAAALEHAGRFSPSAYADTMDRLMVEAMG